METRKLAALLITILNSAAEQIEEAMSEDGDAKEEKDGKSGRSSRSSSSGGKSGSSRNRSRDRDDDDKNDKDDDDKDDDKDEPSEDDVIDAVRGAQKVLEAADIKKILKKHGKADRASEVEAEHRQAVIDALEKAIEAAE